MDFIEVNKQFLHLHRKSYPIVRIIEWDYLIYFVVKSEKEKDIFLNNSYEKCCSEYLNFIKDNNCYNNDFNYEFKVLSEEEVKKKYGGNYYYAML